MKEDTIRELLKKWCEEYGINPETVHWCGYKDLNGTTMGECHYMRKPYHHPWYYCEIYLDIKWKNRSLGWLEESVIWHEYCHAEAYLEDGESDAHNDHWRDLRKRKPKYLIGDWVAKFLFQIL